MGSLIGAFCKCGYESKEMHLGGGFNNFMSNCSFPYYCEDCKTLFIANKLAKKANCPKCKNNNVFPYDDKRACKTKGNEIFEWNITDDDSDKTIILTDGKYICPKCNKYELSFLHLAYYD